VLESEVDFKFVQLKGIMWVTESELRSEPYLDSKSKSINLRKCSR